MMNEQSILLRLTLRQEGKFYHAEIDDEATQIQLTDTGGYSAPRDAIYAALKGLAVENNFTGCLKLDVNNQGIAS